MSDWQPPEYHTDAETFASTLAQICASRGDVLGVALLAESSPTISLSDVRTDFGEDWYDYTLRLDVEPELYGRISEQREPACLRLQKLASEISCAYDRHHDVSTVAIAPVMALMEGWRPKAQAFLRGEGINNQGRARSDNIAARQHDGLLFRSEPEILLYDALKGKGIYLAPLPVLVRGGATFQRLEPDFLVLHKGVLMLVEVDGASVHKESPAEAHARTQGLQRDGVRVERVQAKDCATKQAAERCAAKLIEALERYRELRV